MLALARHGSELNPNIGRKINKIFSIPTLEPFFLDQYIFTRAIFNIFL